VVARPTAHPPAVVATIPGDETMEGMKTISRKNTAIQQYSKHNNTKQQCKATKEQYGRMEMKKYHAII
jgi:hypothetical protein